MKVKAAWHMNELVQSEQHLTGHFFLSKANIGMTNVLSSHERRFGSSASSASAAKSVFGLSGLPRRNSDACMHALESMPNRETCR